MRKHFFLTDLYLATSSDELRPAMNCVFFKDGFAIATDAHILVKQDLTIHEFSPEDIEILNGKMLRRDSLIAMKRYKFFTVTEDGIECIGKSGECTLFKFNNENEVGRFPNVEAVMNFSEGFLNELGINPTLLEKLKKCLFTDGNHLILQFQDNNKKSIHVTAGGYSKGVQFALIMPTLTK